MVCLKLGTLYVFNKVYGEEIVGFLVHSFVGDRAVSVFKNQEGEIISKTEMSLSPEGHLVLETTFFGESSKAVFPLSQE